MRFLRADREPTRRTQMRVTLHARSSALTSNSLDSLLFPSFFDASFFICSAASVAADPAATPGVVAGLGALPDPVCPTTSSIPLAAASAARTSATP